MWFWCFHSIGAIYAATVVTFGVVPGVVGFVAAVFVPAQVRALAALIMLLVGGWAVRCSAHRFGEFLLGCGIFAILLGWGILLRSRRKGTSFLKERPYDLTAFVIGMLVMSLFYEPPLM